MSYNCNIVEETEEMSYETVISQRFNRGNYGYCGARRAK